MTIHFLHDIRRVIVSAVFPLLIVFILLFDSPAFSLTYTNTGQSLAFTNAVGGIFADFDTDGDLDIFVASSSKCEIWNNNGTGTFTNSGQNLGAGNRRPAIKDFDKDGDLDIAIGSSGAGIKIWKNNGSGTFTDSGQTLGTGFTAALAAVDIDADSDYDIIEGTSASGSNKIWLNDGSGTFSLSTSSFGTGAVLDMRAVDFNLDGYDDISIANGANITAYFGTGAGAFSTTTVLVATTAETICVDDFNADSRADIAALSSNGSNEIFQTYTSPSFYFQPISVTLNGYNAAGCFTADLDNDGDTDLIHTGVSAGDLTHIWTNEGSFSFTHFLTTFAFGPSVPIGMADVDSDGDADMAVVSSFPGPSTVGYVYTSDRANPAGGNVVNNAPSAPALSAVGTPTSRSPVLQWSAPADDHSASSQLTYEVRVSTQTAMLNYFSGISAIEPLAQRKTSFITNNMPDGTYYWSVRAIDNGYKKSAWATENIFNIAFSFMKQSGPVSITSSSVTAQFISADFDNDGDADLLSASSNSSYRKLYRNDGALVFTDTGQSFTSAYAQAADIDNDGDLDIAGNNAVYLNNGSGAFAQTSLPFTTGRFCLADADNDGDIDIIAAGADRVYLNNGAGSFGPTGQTGFGSSAIVNCADIDNDGDIDAAVFTETDATFRLYKNDGTGNLGTTSAYELTNQVWEDFTLADVDADGDIDVLPNTDFTLINNAGTFQVSTVSLSNGMPTSITSADFDNDGDTDVFVSAPANMSGIFFKNGGAGDFTPVNEVYIQTGYSPGLSVADINNDNYLDILTSGGSVLLNDLYNGPGGNAPANTAPVAPTLVHHADSSTSTVTLTWNAASDAQTTANLLTYNIRIGSSPGASDIRSGASPIGPGAAGSSESLTVKNLPNSLIYWSVQTVDTAFARSAWSAEESFTVNVPVAFTAATQTLGSASTKAILAADIDADGDADIIEANNGADSIWKNNAGVFSATDLSASDNTNAVAAADVDGDGDLDIIFGNNGPSALYINNAGSFTASAQTFDNADTRDIAVFDADSDGDMDILQGIYGPSSLWMNDGNGTFTKAPPTLAENTYAVATADFNNDGKQDILLCNDGNNTLWLNSGGGLFVNSGQTPGSGTTLSCAASDIDSDGDMDIVLGTISGIKVFMNSGSAVFTDSGQNLGAAQTRGLAIADFDHDGDPDIFAANYGADSKLYLNSGTGTFTDLGADYSGGNATSAAAADIDNDNDLDIVLGIDGAADIILLNNIADSTGGNSPNTPPSAPSIVPVGNPSLNTITLTWFAASDATTPLSGLTYNLRIGTTSGGNEVFSGAISVGSGNAGATSSYTITDVYPGLYFWSAQAVDGDFDRSAWSSEDSFNNIAPLKDSGQTLGNAKAHSVSAADFDGDGDTDVFVGNDGASKLWINNGAGVFTDSGQSLGSEYTMSSFAADFDRDGKIDLAKAEYSGAADIYFNNGTSLIASQTINLTGLSVFCVTGADFDGDGDVDIAFSTFGGANKIFLNDGAGVFTDSGNDMGSNSSYWLNAADVDNDGDIDLVDSTSAGVRLWKNNGAGVFTDTNQTIGPATSARATILFDIDADGDIDLVRGGAKAYICKNDGTGDFGSPVLQLTTTGTASSFHAADVDVDGDFDLAISSNQGTTIWLNDGNGVLADSKQLLGPNYTNAIVMADFDNDSDPDLFAANFNQDSKLWTNLRVSSGSQVPANTPPSAPTPANIGETAPGAVALKWTPGSDATTAAALLRYDIRVGTTQGGSDVYSGLVQKGESTAGATGTHIITLATGTYYWSMRTIDSAHLTSSWSAAATTVVKNPDINAPSFAGLETATDTGIGGSVDLAWSDAIDESTPITYNIYIRTSTGSFNFMSPASTTSATSARMTGLTNGVQYVFIVRARDAKGNEDSNTVEQSATPTAPATVMPNAPSGLSASYSTGSVTLAWTAPTLNNDGSPLTDLSGYNIYRAAECGSASATKLNTSIVATSTYTDSTVLSDTVYFYHVTAVNSSSAESIASGCAMAASYSKGVRGRTRRYDVTGGTVSGTGYPIIGVSGITATLYFGATVIGSAVTDSEGYFVIPVTEDTTGKQYTLKLTITASSGYLGDNGSFTGGTGVRTISAPVTISNEIKEVTIPKLGNGPAVADGNCDWFVNMKDFNVLKAAFSATLGQEKYNIKADFNGDEIINMKDFNILKENFGTQGNEITPSPCD